MAQRYKGRRMDNIWCKCASHTLNKQVITDGKHYGIPKGYCYAFPVRCKDFEYEIVENLALSEFVKEKMQQSFEELKREREEAELE